MGKPTFDSRNSKTSCRQTLCVLVFVQRCPEPSREVLDFRLSSEGMRLPNKIGGFKQTQGTETSKYLEERTSTETPLVVARERGPGQWRTRGHWKTSEKQG